MAAGRASLVWRFGEPSQFLILWGALLGYASRYAVYPKVRYAAAGEVPGWNISRKLMAFVSRRDLLWLVNRSTTPFE